MGTPLGSITGLGPLGLEGGDSAVSVFSTIISWTIGLMTLVAGVYFLFQFITAGYDYMSSQNDKSKIQGAQRKIVNSIMGLIIVIGAYALMGLLGYVFGIDFFKVGSFISNIWSP